MDATYHSLAGGSFFQDWTNTNLITTTNDGMTPGNTAGYENVPSIMGYQGRDDSGSITAVDPQTVLTPRIADTDTPPGRVAILANQTNAATLLTGGVAEFDTLTDPVVALQGSGTSDAPFLLLHVDSTGVSSVRVSYTLRDVDGSADNAVQPIALQYRIGTSGDFINVPGGFVADASSGPSQATLVTDVSQVLPVDTSSASQLQIRVITTNAAGNDEWIGIDNIRVENGAVVNNGAFAFSSATYTQVESGNATITINRSGGTTGAVSVRAQTIAGGTATSGSDYTVFDQVINFADGQASATFDVVLNDDATAEPPETVFLQLSDPTGGATLGGQTSATLTIDDNDATAPTGVLLNEIDVNPPATDNPFEYVEISGTAAQNLFGTYFVSIEGDTGATLGQITMVENLSDNTIGSNGLLMIKSPTGGFTPPSGTSVVTNATLDTTGGLQNGSNSFLIVFSPTALTAGLDLDTNDDGTLDLPGGAVVLDGVSWLDGGNIADRAYGSAILTLTTGFNPPDAATRFVGNTAANNADAWFFGDLEGTQDTINYNQATVTTSNPGGIPAGTVVLTPGDVNFNGASNVTATADFVFDAYPTPQTITIAFSGDVSASLATDDIVLTNITTNTVIPAASIALSYNSGTNTASFTFPSFGNGGSLPDGNYTLSLPAANVTPNLTGDLNFSFFAFAGDSNRDRIVNINDFSTLAANFNQSPRTFSQGDYDYNGIVNINDFSTLASKFNQTLPAPADLPRAASAPVASLFSGKKISEDSLIDLVA